VPLLPGAVTAAAVPELVERFREHYLEAYGVQLDTPVELVNLRVRLTRVVEKPPAPVATAPVGGSSQDGTRLARFAGVGTVEAAVHRWERMGQGDSLVGPCLVDGADTTVVVPPGHRSEVDARGDLVLSREG
jgi:N-methylhydantoinase A